MAESLARPALSLGRLGGGTSLLGALIGRRDVKLAAKLLVLATILPLTQPSGPALFTVMAIAF